MNGETKSPRFKNLVLSRKLALFLLGIPVLFALGVYSIDAFLWYKNNIAPLDPWYTDTTFWKRALTGVLFIYTIMMMKKQWSYYFESGKQGKAGFFVETGGIFNDLEWAADFILSFWGGILILSALGMPSFWLLLTSIYFFLVFIRCRITLNRKKYAKRWRMQGETSGPNYSLWSTYPYAMIVEAAKSAGFVHKENIDNWDTRLQVMEESLDWEHPTAKYKDNGFERTLKAKEILAGWDWVDRMYAFIGIVFSGLSWIILMLSGTGPVSFFTIVILGGLIFVFFLYLGDASKAWGINNWDKIVEK